MKVKKNIGQGEVHGEVFCFGGGRYTINQSSRQAPKWLSSVMLSDIIGMTCRHALAFDDHTRKELRKDSKTLAKALLALGVKKGDFLVILDNFYPCICAVYAAMRIGAVAVPFAEDASREILAKFIMEQKGDTFVITNNQTPDYASKLCKKTAYKCKCVISINEKRYKEKPIELGKEYYDYREMPVVAKMGHRRLRIPWSTGETIMLGSSSGTSGEMKFFPYTDRNIVSSVLSTQIAVGVSLFKHSSDVWAGVVPRRYPYGLLNSALLPSWGRRSVKLVGPDDTVDDLFSEADVICCATDFTEIVQKELTISGYSLTKNGKEKPITIIIGGAYLTPEKSDEFLNFLQKRGFNAKIRPGYGISEAAGCVSVVPESNYRPGTVGRLVPGVKVWLRKDDGSAYKLGEQGRLWVSGANVVQTYNTEMANQKNICRDDDGEVWVDTGDYVSLHQNGYLEFHCSEKEFYITNDAREKVYTKKAEEAIEQMDGVSRCWVLGEPKRSASVAFIAPEKGVDGEILKQKIIQNIAKSTTASGEFLREIEIPRYYKIVSGDDLQINKAGKRLKVVKDRLMNLVDFDKPDFR